MSFSIFTERFLVIQHPHFVVMHLTPRSSFGAMYLTPHPPSPEGIVGFNALIYNVHTSSMRLLFICILYHLSSYIKTRSKNCDTTLTTNPACGVGHCLSMSPRPPVSPKASCFNTLHALKGVPRGLWGHWGQWVKRKPMSPVSP